MAPPGRAGAWFAMGEESTSCDGGVRGGGQALADPQLPCQCWGGKAAAAEAGPESPAVCRCPFLLNLDGDVTSPNCVRIVHIVTRTPPPPPDPD